MYKSKFTTKLTETWRQKCMFNDILEAMTTENQFRHNRKISLSK